MSSNFIIYLIVALLIVSCSNKREAENFSIEQPDFGQLEKDKPNAGLKLAKRMVPKATHFFVNRIELPYYRTDTTPQRILLIGDSMSKWLRYRLQDYCEENGHKLSTVTWVSGNTEWFAQYDTLRYYIQKDSISYVFLVLGSNELFIRDFAKHRAHYVDSIVKKLEDFNWIWVGPPNWNKDKGINACLLEKLSERKFFVSKDLKFKRQKDGMHPTVSSCSMWVDSIVSWIKTTSTSRIRLNVPDSTYGLKPDAIVLKPLQ